MRGRGFAVLAFTIILALADRTAAGEDNASPDRGQAKKVLVELYTSQGCDSCPPASDLFGMLAKLGYGPDRIVPIGFHVDYFNQPWADPYSDPSYSRRELSYNQVMGRKDLYFTPLMMVDGRTPLLGSDRAKALEAMERALREPPEVRLKAELEQSGRTGTLTVSLDANANGVAGRDLLVGVALCEGPVSTPVLTGENAGKTLVEHHVVRAFHHKFTRLSKTGTQRLTFPLKLPEATAAERTRVSVFVQDRLNGKVYQADSVRWGSAQSLDPGAERARDLKRTSEIRKQRRALLTRNGAADLAGLGGAFGAFAPQATAAGSSASMDDDLAICNDCGSLFAPRNLMGLPAGLLAIPRGTRFTVPSISC